MGMCNCNVKSQMLIQADYSVPISQEDKYTLNKFTNSQSKNINATTITSTTITKEISRLRNESRRQSQFIRTKRAFLFQQITEKNSSSTTYVEGTRNVHGEISDNNSIMVVKGKLSEAEEKKLMLFISNNFFFRNFNKKPNDIIKYMKLCSLDENKNVFLEGEEGNCMYIIISGECELYKKGINKTLTLSSFESFGELGVVDPSAYRAYSIKTKTNMLFYSLDEKSYKSLRVKSTLEKKDISKKLKSIPFFSFLEDGDIDNLSKFAYSIKLNQSTSSIKLNETFYIIKSGKLDCFDDKSSSVLTIEKNMYYGMRNLLLSEQQSLTVIPKEETILYIIPQKAFIEILGVDYQYNLIYPYFKAVMMGNALFGKIFNELILVPVYSIFTVKQYNIGDIVYKKGSKGKLVILFEGELVFDDKTSNDYDHGNIKHNVKINEIFGGRIILSNNELDCDIKAKYNTIVLESDWNDMQKKILSLNTAISKKVKNLSRMRMTKNAKLSKLIEISTMLTKEKYSKGDIIIKSRESAIEDNVHFYMIIKGEVKLKHKGETIRHYGQYNTFGEMFMLNVQDPTDEIIVTSDELKVYALEQKNFLYLIAESAFNDYIKHKMCNEDREIKISELNYVDNIRGSIAVVNNADEFYFAKFFIKNKDNMERVTNEDKTMRHIDNAFIQKIVKVIYDKSYGIILYENIEGGIFLNDIQNIPIYHKDIIVFYAACFISILNYIHSHHYIHRNISVSNILIDSNGYPYLTNFSYCKKLKSDSTSTLLEISHFSSPEMLSSSKYSYETDYWSIGICLYYLYYRRYPFRLESNDPMKIYKEIIRTEFEYPNTDENLHSLLSGLLCKEKEKRLCGYGWIKKEKIFNEVDFEMINSRKYKPKYNINRINSKIKRQKSRMSYEEYLSKDYNWDESF